MCFCMANVQAKPIVMTCSLPNQGETAQETYIFTVEDDPAEKLPAEKIKVLPPIYRKDFSLTVESVKRSDHDNHLIEIHGIYNIPTGTKDLTYPGGKWELKETKVSSPLESTWSSDFGGVREEYKCELRFK